MVNWQITAKTIYCDAVRDEVTIIIKKDWSVNCTGFTGAHGTSAPSKGKSSCEGLGCPRVLRYKESLMQEEKA